MSSDCCSWSPAPPTPIPSATAPPETLTIISGLAPGAAPAVAWGDGRYLVTFSAIEGRAQRDLFGLRLAADGAAIDADPLLLSDLGPDPYLGPATASYAGAAIAADAAGFGVFFFGSGTIGTDGPPGQIIAFTSVPMTGSPVLPATELASEASFSMAQTFLTPPSAAASDGARFVGLYQRGFSLVGSGSFDQVLGDFVTVTGGAIEPQATGVLGGTTIPPMNIVADAAPAGVASSGSATLAAWIESSASIDTPQNPSTSLEAALLAPGEATRIRLSDATPGSGSTAVATDGAGFLVAWNATTLEDPSTLSEIRAIRYLPGGGAGRAGSIEPAGGFVVAGGPGIKVLADVAYAGGTYLATWLEDGVLRGARIADDAATATPFTIAPGPVNGAALASDGARFLVVFEEPQGIRADLLGLFVDATG